MTADSAVRHREDGKQKNLNIKKKQRKRFFKRVFKEKIIAIEDVERRSNLCVRGDHKEDQNTGKQQIL